MNNIYQSFKIYTFAPVTIIFHKHFNELEIVLVFFETYYKEGPGELTQKLRSLVALPKESGWILYTLMVAHNPPITRDLLDSMGTKCTYIKHIQNKNNIIKNNFNRDGEMAQWLRALTAPPKVLSSNPSSHMVAHNHP